MYICNEKAMKFHIIMLNLPLTVRGEKWEMCDNNIFLENISHITQADAIAIFGLALMVDSKWKRFREVEVGSGGVTSLGFALLCHGSQQSSSLFLSSFQGFCPELRAYITDSQSYRWTKMSRADIKNWTH